MNEQEAYREAVRDQIVNNDRILMQAATILCTMRLAGKKA